MPAIQFPEPAALKPLLSDLIGKEVFFQDVVRDAPAPADIGEYVTLYVGDDDERDAEGARRAGMTPVRVDDLPSFAALPDHLATLRAPHAPR